MEQVILKKIMVWTINYNHYVNCVSKRFISISGLLHYKKVKLTLEQAMKALRGSRCIALLFL
jgi:hypothetical protein